MTKNSFYIRNTFCFVFFCNSSNENTEPFSKIETRINGLIENVLYLWLHWPKIWRTLKTVLVLKKIFYHFHSRGIHKDGLKWRNLAKLVNSWVWHYLGFHPFLESMLWFTCTLQTYLFGQGNLWRSIDNETVRRCQISISLHIFTYVLFSVTSTQFTRKQN